MRKGILILLLLFPFRAKPQQLQSKELTFNHLFVKDGLPESQVNCLMQDKEKYIWAGTEKGLMRYDGRKPKSYDLGVKTPYLSITTLFEDRNGNLWVGTKSEGLFLYDRANDSFRHYAIDPAKTGGKSDTEIQEIYNAINGDLWVQTAKIFGQQIVYLRPATGATEVYSIQEKGRQKLNSALILGFIQTKDGRFLLGGQNGLFEYITKEKRFVGRLVERDSSVMRNFFRPDEDPLHPGTVWVSVENTVGLGNRELWEINTKDFNVRKFGKNKAGTGLADSTIFAVKFDSRNRLWVGTDSGLSCFNRQTSSWINYIPGYDRTNPLTKAVANIVEDKKGNLWCENYWGLLFFDTKNYTFTCYPPNKVKEWGAYSNGVMHLMLDNSGNPWFNTYKGQGLYWMNTKASSITRYINGDVGSTYTGGTVFSFSEAPDKTFWLGTTQGLYHWDPVKGSFENVKFVPNQPEIINVKTVVVDKKGLVWFGAMITWSLDYKGLYCFDPVTRQVKNFRLNKTPKYPSNNPLHPYFLSNNFFSFVEKNDDEILLGSAVDGFLIFDKRTGTFSEYPHFDEPHGELDNKTLDGSNVQSIYKDQNGQVWIGTAEGGLTRFDETHNTFTGFKDLTTGLKSVTAIAGDSRNRLWVGTYAGGVFLFDKATNTYKKFSEKDGLLYDGASCALEDNRGNMWIGSTRGISIVNIKNNKVRTLTAENGLSSENIRCAFKTSSGLFLFGCKGGFIALDPQSFFTDTTPPVVHIQTVDITNRDHRAADSSIVASGKKEIHLKYNDNNLIFRYVSISFQDAQLNKYRYKLEGIDKNWIDGGTKNEASYNNLAPGTYTFHVMAANSDGVWTKDAASVVISISPPWWKTWIAICAYFVLFVLALWQFILYRNRSILEKNRVLEAKIADRTAELQTSLVDLKATQKQLIQSEKMASLGELTAGIAHEIQNPLNFVNNFSDVNTELVVELQEELKAGNAEEAFVISNEIKENEQKINHHGKRAESIVRGMLQHSRANTGKKELTNINALADEYLRLSYHGLRAKDKSFTANLITEFDKNVGKIEVASQDIGRVLLNLFNNAFYSVSEKKKALDGTFEPTVWVTTKRISSPSGGLEISVKDNGTGIPQKVLEKIYQPFFTTKPTGQGTGLGLSLSYDIIKAHGGELKVETKEGEGAEFKIKLPADLK